MDSFGIEICSYGEISMTYGTGALLCNEGRWIVMAASTIGSYYWYFAAGEMLTLDPLEAWLFLILSGNFEETIATLDCSSSMSEAFRLAPRGAESLRCRSVEYYFLD